MPRAAGSLRNARHSHSKPTVESAHELDVYDANSEGKIQSLFQPHIWDRFPPGSRGAWGIDQARDKPSQWPQGAEGYGDRFGSAAGQIVARGTTEYLIADIVREDVRFIPRSSPAESKFKAAVEDTFLARKGEDGHNAFSIAHLVGPAAGGAIALNTWYPSGYGGVDVAREIGVSYGFQLVRNFVREIRKH